MLSLVQEPMVPSWAERVPAIKGKQIRKTTDHTYIKRWNVHGTEMETLTQPGPREGDAQTDPGRVVKGSPNTQGVRKHFKQREEIILEKSQQELGAPAGHKVLQLSVRLGWEHRSGQWWSYRMRHTAHRGHVFPGQENWTHPWTSRRNEKAFK